MAETFFADTARFPHETIEDETVLVDSQLGHLFLFTGLGPWLWQRMRRGGTVDGVVEEVTERFGADAAAPTLSFLETLVEAKLLRPDAALAGALGEDIGMPCPDVFTIPAMERYEDIADIIAMDPIHDVDTTKGWPHRNSGPE